MIQKVVFVTILCFLLNNQPVNAMYPPEEMALTEQERSIVAIKKALECLILYEQRAHSRTYTNDIIQGVVPDGVLLSKDLGVAFHKCLFSANFKGVSIRMIYLFALEYFFTGENERCRNAFKAYSKKYPHLEKIGRALELENVLMGTPEVSERDALLNKIIALYDDAKSDCDDAAGRFVVRRKMVLAKMIGWQCSS